MHKSEEAAGQFLASCFCDERACSVAILSNALERVGRFFATRFGRVGRFLANPTLLDVSRMYVADIDIFDSRYGIRGTYSDQCGFGGAQAGWKSVLVTDHGLLKGMDIEATIRSSGIRPDYIIPTT